MFYSLLWLLYLVPRKDNRLLNYPSKEQNKKIVDFLSHPKSSGEETHKNAYLKETANKTTWALTQFPAFSSGWAPAHADLLNGEGTACFKPVRQRESLLCWNSSAIVEDALMHCGSEDKQTLWCITEAGKHKCGRRHPWTCQIKRAPSRCVRHERSSNVHFFYAINNKVQIQA